MVDAKSMDKCFKVISNTDYQGKWLCLFFWPMDFTFVCPIEIATFGAKEAEFKKRGCEVIGCSVDGEYVHLAWKERTNTAINMKI